EALHQAPIEGHAVAARQVGAFGRFGIDLPVPWLLAGGLTPDNVAQAVQATGARQVDVSSGVETAPGQKDPALIAAFAEALSFVPSPG
ncbi:MAG: hypothetical protein AAFY68_10245, partial [Pseudomonadota bacterium]